MTTRTLIPHSHVPSSFVPLTPYRVALLASLGLLTSAGFAADTNWSFKADLTLKETFDSNVYIQDEKPTPANTAAAQAAGFTPVQAKQQSFVTSILPKFTLDYRPCAAFNVAASYVPEIVYYHAESSEDYVAHRGTLNLGGKWDQVTYDLLNTVAYIDGNDIGPTFARPGDVPAIGGIPLRDRREAFVFRNVFRLTYPIGDFFLRPVCSTYFHDFKTDQRATPAGAPFVYENYIDRQDVSGGLDVGYKVAEKTSVVLGYRYGAQDQFKLLGVNSPYDSTYQRVLVGIEGTPWDWVKLNVLLGPEFRDFSDRATQTYPQFDDNEQLYYVDASIAFLPTARDTITLANRRYEQPAFSSFSVYEDITYALIWKHKLDDHFTVGAGFQLYIGDWQAPVSREDWIYTPSASVGYTYKKLSAELAYSYDWVVNQADVVPGTQTAYAEGREYTRHLVSLSAKYSF